MGEGERRKNRVRERGKGEGKGKGGGIPKIVEIGWENCRAILKLLL